MNHPTSSPSGAHCANCGRPLVARRQAPHKRFCSDHCRTDWWNARTKQAKALLEQQEQSGGGAATQSQKGEPQQ